MSKEMLINVTLRETRVGVIENGMLQEVHVERSSHNGYVGNVYKGRVQRAMAGEPAAFVDIGLERAAYLHASDIVRTTLSDEMPEHDQETDDHRADPILPINELVHEGQEIVVQAVKDPIGTKGIRLSTHLSIPSRYLVLLPCARTLGISARIEDETERERLKKMMNRLSDEAGKGMERLGYIIRTNAEGQDDQALAFDVNYLGKVWRVVQENMARAKVGDHVYQELSLPLRGVRDLLNPQVEKVRVDSQEMFQKVSGFVCQFMPSLTDRVEYYNDEQPIFDLYGAEDEITHALEKKVPLKSGGYLIVDQTEAMTTIDVNTGSYVGSCNLEETVYRTNLEAAKATARQLRLRNLGGIIIIDFIDMINEEHRQQVLRVLKKGLLRDHVKTTVYPMSDLGLVEMTRRRTTESLERQLCEPCPNCVGRGKLKTSQTVSYEIFREIVRAVRQFNPEQLMVLASPAVVHRILEDESGTVAELEASTFRNIRFRVEENYTQEQFDVVLL